MALDSRRIELFAEAHSGYHLPVQVVTLHRIRVLLLTRISESIINFLCGSGASLGYALSHNGVLSYEIELTRRALLSGQGLKTGMSQSMRIFSYIGVGCVLAISLCRGGGLEKLSPGEHDAPIRDVQVHYTVAGKGPLLFVCSPGWGAGSLYLQQGLAPLEEHFTLLFIDTRGSGKSSKPQDATRMTAVEMADDIEALRSYLSLDC